jgi:hypothetical protein
MRCSRLFAVLIAAMLLVVYSGCGGEGKKDASFSDTGAKAQAKSGEKTGERSAGKTAETASLGTQAVSEEMGTLATTGAVSVPLFTPDHFAAVVIHPRRIAQSPLVAEQLQDAAIAGEIKRFGVDPNDVEELVILFSMNGRPAGHSDPVAVVIARFNYDVVAKEVLAKLQAAGSSSPPPPITEINVGGKICLDLGPGDAPMAYLPNRNTIVLTSKENMGKMVSVTEPKGPLWQRLKKVESGNDIIVAMESSAYPDFDKSIDEAKKGAPLNLDAAKGLRGGTATLNLAAPALLRMVLDSEDAESAGRLEELLQQALRMAGGGLTMAKQSMPKEAQAAMGPLMKLADEVFDGARIGKSGGQVVLEVKRPEILDTGGASIVGAIRQSILEARAAAGRAQRTNNLRQIAIAMLMYEQTQQSFPPAVIEKGGRPLLSWRVAILPFLDWQTLYNRFHLDEPWDSPHNLEVAKTVPSVFQSPGSPTDGKTQMMLFTGRGAAFDGGKNVRMADIRDGASNTILCVEAGPDKAVPWTKPEDLPFDPTNPLSALGDVSPQGFLAALFNGRVLQLKVDNATLKALITPDGGEPIDPASLRGRP